MNKSDFEMHLAIPDMSFTVMDEEDWKRLESTRPGAWGAYYDPVKAVTHFYFNPPTDPDERRRFNLALAPVIEAIRRYM